MKAETREWVLGGGFFLVGAFLLFKAALEVVAGNTGPVNGLGGPPIPGWLLIPWSPALLATAGVGIWIVLGHGQRLGLAVAGMWLVVGVLDLVLNGRILILPGAVVAVALAVEHRRGTSYDLAGNVMRLVVWWGLVVLVLGIAFLIWSIAFAR